MPSKQTGGVLAVIATTLKNFARVFRHAKFSGWSIAGFFWLLFLGGLYFSWNHVVLDINQENTAEFTEVELQPLSSKLLGDLTLNSEQSLISYRYTVSIAQYDRRYLLDFDNERLNPLATEISNNILRHPLFFVLLVVIFVVVVFEAAFLFFLPVFQSNYSLVKRYGRLGTYIKKSFEFHIIGIIFFCSIWLSYFLFEIGVFFSGDASDTGTYMFWSSQVNVFGLSGFILALTASIYAVYTKIIADLVNENTDQLQNTVAGFFTSFSEAMDDKATNSIPQLIDQAERSIKIYLGNPVVGFFRDETIGKLISSKLKNKVEKHKEDSDFEFKAICWSPQKGIDYMAASVYRRYHRKDAPHSTGQTSITDLAVGHIQEYLIERGGLYKSIVDAENSELYHHEGDVDPPFRFLIIDGRKAILWVLENASAEGAAIEESSRRARAGGFKTELGYMVTVLEGVFDSAISAEIVSKITLEDFQDYENDRKEHINAVLKKANEYASTNI